MKNYIKPTFTLAGLFPVALAAGGCTIPLKDYADIMDLYEADAENAFATGEGCNIELPIDGVCKYTMQESGTAATIIGS